MNSHILPFSATQPASSSPLHSKVHPSTVRTLAQITHIPVHICKHSSAILFELCTSIKELHQILPLVIKYGFYNDELFQTKLVSLFCNYGSLTEAARVFEPIENNLEALYHTMLKGYAKNSSLDDALSFFCRMRHDNVTPVVYNFTYLLKLCGDNSDIRKGKEIHGQLITSGFSWNVFAMTGVVCLYAKCRQIGDAYKMFDRMPERDLVCWNTIISRYAQNGLPQVALELVPMIFEEGQ